MRRTHAQAIRVPLGDFNSDYIFRKRLYRIENIQNIRTMLTPSCLYLLFVYYYYYYYYYFFPRYNITVLNARETKLKFSKRRRSQKKRYKISRKDTQN
jgi:hypothetical protein